MANDLIDQSGKADGSPPIVPIAVLASLSEAYTAWDSTWCLTSLIRSGYADQIPYLADGLMQGCEPIARSDLTQRLTALGMMMSPNRPAAEATVWLHEMTRLLHDLPKDILYHAIDECQRRNRFLPTVAEIRDVADPLVTERRKHAAKLDAMRRLLDNGFTIAAPAPSSHKLCTGEQAEQILRDEGLLETVRGKSAVKIDRGPRRKPTRQDYLDMGVDPGILDSISGA